MPQASSHMLSTGTIQGIIAGILIIRLAITLCLNQHRVLTPRPAGTTRSFTLGNNIEMKVKSDKDSTGYKKISIIDAFDINMSYNTAAKVRPWSDMNINLRLKWWKNYTFNMNAVFATYAYEMDENGNVYVGNHTELLRRTRGKPGLLVHDP